MSIKKNYGGLDYFKIAAAFLVVAIHTSPLALLSAEGDFFLTRILARIAVPYFLMVTGFFVLPDYLFNKNTDYLKIWHFFKKVALLYVFSVLLYLPVGIYAGYYKKLTVLSVLRMALFDGTFYHLWYFPAVIIGVLLLCLLSRRLPFRYVTWVCLVLYVFGLFGDSYYGVIEKVPFLDIAYQSGFQLFSYTRNGLFLAPIFLLMGAWFGNRKYYCKRRVSSIGFVLSLLLMTAEGFILHHFKLQKHDSMYFMLVPCLFFLFQFVLSWRVRPNKHFRTISMIIYIIHPLVIVLIRGVAKYVKLTNLLVDNNLIHFMVVAIISAVIAVIISLLPLRKKNDDFLQDRAWIEVNRNALKHNVDTLRSLLPNNCELMPAVKAEAYGHGAVLISRELNEIGVKAFCVASVTEGAHLRRNGIKGDILILGYTHPKQFELLRRYRLIQTVVDYAYAKILNQYGQSIRVHIGIDTGMHRLGERCENFGALCDMFRMKNLKIEGLYTHLSSDDTTAPDEKAFTEAQAKAFYDVVNQLKKQGFYCPKVHLQASYGVLNYPELSGDYARVGIALYGILSTKEDTQNSKVLLEPVLSVKARIATVKKLYYGETAGYGLSYVAKQDMKIAVIAIGYADGFPRALSDGIGKVLINGCEAPIIGRVCMDQTLVDVTDIPDVKSGDVAVVIGQSGDREITASDLAMQTDTITNEILSRLGERLKRTVV